MSFENQQWSWSLKAGEDLDDTTPSAGDLHKAVSNDDGKVANYGYEATGILKYGGKNGEHISIATTGICKYAATGTVSIGNRLTVTTSGWFRAAKLGEHSIGTALISSTSGSIGTGIFDFTKPTIHDDYVAFTTTNNLSATTALGKAVAAAGDVASASFAADGVLTVLATSGTTGYFRPFGVVQAAAGDVITINRSLKVGTSGYFFDADSGDLLVGRALAASASGNSGSTFSAVVNFSTPHYATSCLDVMY